jgi:hypothetical protein
VRSLETRLDDCYEPADLTWEREVRRELLDTARAQGQDIPDGRMHGNILTSSFYSISSQLVVPHDIMFQTQYFPGTIPASSIETITDDQHGDGGPVFGSGVASR